MKLVVGLGNPGSKYSRTRHNAGFLVLEALSQRSFRDEPCQLRSVSPWRERFKGLCAEGEIVHTATTTERSSEASPANPARAQSKSTNVLLLMPQTFMNLSGESVREALGFYKLGPEDLIVCHDDIDLPFGTVRVRQGGGEGGHNGLRSICSQLGAKQYFRIRIGVGRPDSRAPNDTGVSDGIRMVTDAERHASVSDWVLSNFAKDEEKRLPEVLVRAGEAALLLICRGLAFTQQQIHRLTP